MSIEATLLQRIHERAGTRALLNLILARALVGALLVLGALGGCGRSTSGGDPCADGMCPCTWSWDCPAGYDCVNQRCVVHPLPDGGLDASPGLLGFGEICEENRQCESTYCIADLQGSFCTLRCDQTCPTGWGCRLVPDPHGTGEAIGLCVVDRLRVCEPCLENADCNPSGGDLCLDIGDGLGCGRDCTFEGCPQGYECQDVVAPQTSGRQCVPTSGTCECTEASAGQVRGCERTNDLGTCRGQRICDYPGGWSDCSAQEPAPESCNGLDDDCNGQADEGMDPRPCTASAGGWTCTGTEVCAGPGGWLCDAPTPEPESCDGADNNCDGQIDEGFLDAAGRYVGRHNCGDCSTDCDAIVAHAAATDCVIFGEQPTCIATACLPGYFPYLEGRICLALPDTLCDPCVENSDCVAPGSQCLERGPERYCGRSCSPSSPYGTGCPTGYTCVAGPSGEAQCEPISGTCLCTGDRLGATRACTVQTCTGFETCAVSGSGFDWSPCDISHTVEICDGLDNNCDGQIDEGFLDPTTGRYIDDENCGDCGNDCTKYWSPEVHHAVGGCDASGAMPACHIQQCLTEVDAGVTYEWVNVNGDESDGCECRRVQGNTTTDLPDRGVFPEPGTVYVDENCDGVDGVVADAIFVWAGNPSPGSGTRTDPYRTLGQGLAALPASGKAYVLVAEGTYPENIVLREGDQLFGGYSSDFLRRDVLLFETTIQGVDPTSPSQQGAITAVDLGNGVTETVVSGFHVAGRDMAAATPQNAPGGVSVAIYARDCGPGLVLQNNLIRGGFGGPGGRGSTGDAGFGSQESGALDGGQGLDAVRQNGPCWGGTARPGGSGGENPVCPSGTAHDGGQGVCPSFDFGTTPYSSPEQQYVSPTGNDGDGGWDWSFDPFSGSTCSHVTESGWPSNIHTHNGQDGLDGADGTPGTGGDGCASGYGTIAAALWVHTTWNGTPGTAGGPGAAGGGGGAGGGTAFHHNSGSDCPSHEKGATGGGGGAGACGGEGGHAGGDGGASIAVLVVSTSPATTATLPTIYQNRIRRGVAGDGGTGGFGGPGGWGGSGGFGGEPTTWSASVGGKGGDGGNGGPAGGGGGGCGGPSYGILGYNVTFSPWGSSNLFDYDSSTNTGGLGGLGGGGAGPNGVGGDGEPGPFANLLYLHPCQPGGVCPTNLTCDANNVCIPD